MEAARLIKSKNPNSAVEVKDLHSGALAVIAHAVCVMCLPSVINYAQTRAGWSG
jgi:hypothetical protein